MEQKKQEHRRNIQKGRKFRWRPAPKRRIDARINTWECAEGRVRRH